MDHFSGLRAGHAHLKSLLISEELPESALQIDGVGSPLDLSALNKTERVPSPLEIKPESAAQFLTFTLPEPPAPRGLTTGHSSPLTSPNPHQSQLHFSHLLPSLIAIRGRILQELENSLSRLLTLNPSRREAVALYLDRLAGHPVNSTTGGGGPALSLMSGHTDAAGGLRRWIEGPRTPAQNTALQSYFEELALVVIGEAILLKVWADRGHCVWKETDLGNLNHALNQALKSKIPLDREGWHITQRNLYSWYNPSVSIQKEIWLLFQSWRITDEGPGFLTSLITPLRQSRPAHEEPQGYDPRLFQAIWKLNPRFGFDASADTGPMKRGRVVFTPTLRDGALVRTGPMSLTWIGMENSSFQLMMAELVQLWWGPAAPPLWATGTGLEVHSRDQLALDLGAPKPSLLSRITEMEACDAAYVLEERTIRIQSRTVEGRRFREQVEKLSFFKKLKAPGASLGDLQSCVALSKLRPGGLLWWAREEPLSAIDGNEVLNFLLDRARVVCEWDFSTLEHHLPSALPLVPKHLYLLVREPNVEARLNHRPFRVSVSGNVRSHVEIPAVLEAALTATLERGDSDSLGTPHPWEIRLHQSPSPQKDWSEHWPDPTSQNTLRAVEALRTVSLPLANFATVKLTPAPSPDREGRWSMHSTLKGFWIEATDGRSLATHSLPTPEAEAKGAGILVLVSDESWIAPLRAYLDSTHLRNWMDCHAERRSDRWVITEQLARFIPVPKTLLKALGVPGVAGPDSAFAQPLPGDWERLASLTAIQPSNVREALEKLPPGPNPTANEIRAAIFVRAARALDTLRTGQNRLLSIVTPEGRVKWCEILNILPKSECVAVTLHPKVEISGHMPPHLPIGRIERIKMPAPGLMLATESGFHLTLCSQNALIAEMLAEQIEGLSHPTWNELVRYLRLPRRLELAETTASDVLRSHGEQTLRMKQLEELLREAQAN